MEPSDLGWLDVNLQLMEVCGLGDIPVQLTFLISCQHSLSPTARHRVTTPPASAGVPSCPHHGRGLQTDLPMGLLRSVRTGSMPLEIQMLIWDLVPQTPLSPKWLCLCLISRPAALPGLCRGGE